MNVDSIIKEISAYLSSEATLWVAYSGGLDSSVLLHMVSQQSLPTKAIHINHQLSPNAAQWQAHCEHTAAGYGIPFVSEHVHVENHGGGKEEAARLQRYAVFERVVKQGDVILFAHHRDDLAETFLFRLARGAGMRGLVGIKKTRSLGEALLLRPLLGYTKKDLHAYAEKNAIEWINDESNEEEVFDRNFIRHRVMPTVKTRWPQFVNRIANTAAWLDESQTLLDEYADEDLIRCVVQRERLGESICLNTFRRFNFARQKHCIRRWCEKKQYTLPDAVVLEKLPELLNARDDASPLIAWGQCELRRYNKRVFLTPKLPAVVPYDFTWSISEALTLPDGSVLRVKEPSKVNTTLIVRNRRAGDRCKPHSRASSQSVKKLMQEYKLEPWLRDRAPLICCENEIVSVANLFYCQNNNRLVNVIKSIEWIYLY